MPSVMNLSCFFYRIVVGAWLIGILFSSLYANQELEFAVLYKGRYRPAEAYARLWLYEFYHAQTIKKRDLEAFHMPTSSPLTLLWSVEFLGNSSLQTAPLFWIRSAELKRLANLQLTRDRFSYLELQEAIVLSNKTSEATITQEIQKNDKKLAEDWSALLANLKEFERLATPISEFERAFIERTAQLQAKGTSPIEIGRILELEYPIIQRLQLTGSLFKSLPSRFKAGEWLPLQALTVKIYHPSSNSLGPVNNFTLFSDAHFEAIRQAYLAAQKVFADSSAFDVKQKNLKSIATALDQAYFPLAGTTYQEAYGKRLTYPSILQLKVETLYMNYPWIPLLILLYGLAIFLLIAAYRFPFHFLKTASIGMMSLALLFHTAILIMRCYILERPPVSNMFETVIYVPWVGGIASLLLPSFRCQPFVLIASCLSSIILLLIIELTALNQNLDQIQAVLDSQFWLMIHVLLVVGSYGFFILSAILGHFYLGLFLYYHKETSRMIHLSRFILQTMYGGTILLITGTILGGIWAAESWAAFGIGTQKNPGHLFQAASI